MSNSLRTIITTIELVEKFWLPILPKAQIKTVINCEGSNQKILYPGKLLLK